MPDSGTIVGLDADNDKISRIGDCIKSIPGFVAGEWEGDRWVFDVGTGNVAFRGYLSRAGGVILAIGGTADPDRTEKMIEFIRLRLGADADILTVDGSLVPELPMERVPINEKAGHQEDNLMKAMEALAINRVVYRRGNAITIPDTSITVKTRHGPRKQIGLATVTRAILMARLERCCLFHTIQNSSTRAKVPPGYSRSRGLWPLPSCGPTARSATGRATTRRPAFFTTPAAPYSHRCPRSRPRTPSGSRRKP